MHLKVPSKSFRIIIERKVRVWMTIDEYNEQLNALLAECEETAKRIRDQKGHSYNSAVRFEDYLLNGPQDILYEIHKKVLRIKSLLAIAEAHPEGTEPIWDSVYDIINYAKLLYAVLKMREERSV